MQRCSANRGACPPSIPEASHTGTLTSLHFNFQVSVSVWTTSAAVRQKSKFSPSSLFAYSSAALKWLYVPSSGHSHYVKATNRCFGWNDMQEKLCAGGRKNILTNVLVHASLQWVCAFMKMWVFKVFRGCIQDVVTWKQKEWNSTTSLHTTLNLFFSASAVVTVSVEASVSPALWTSSLVNLEDTLWKKTLFP